MTRGSDQVGRVLSDRYRLLAPIGRGASAQVFVASDTRLGRKVAVKVLHAGLAGDKDLLRRFQAEAQAAAALSHPNLLAVFDWGHDDEVPWIVTEYLDGGSIRGLLDAGHRLSPSQALVVGLQTARGLDYAHRRGFVHRDIKPANILFSDDGRLRIADFGLARALAESAWTEPTGEGLLGTARYASPEQAQGQILSERSDVYSLALVLVEAVTGQVPFAGDTTLGTLMGRVGHDLDVPAELEALVPVLAEAGKADPGDRPTAAQLAEMLADVSSDLPRPEPLPLVGSGLFDLDSVDPDPTFHGGAARDDDAPVDQVADDATIAENGPIVAPPSGPIFDDELEDEDDPRFDPRSVTGRPRRRWPRVLLALICVGALGVVTGLLVAELTRDPQKATIPAVTGLDQESAVLSLQRLGWSVKIERTRVVETAKGDVLHTRPKVGTELEKGKTITLVISDGQPIIDLPKIAPGTDKATTENIIRFTTLVPVYETKHDEKVPADSFIGFSGSPPAKIEMGSTVHVVLSSGPEPRTIPDGLVGASQDDVSTVLTALGLKVKVSSTFSDSVAAGKVMAIDPRAGTQVPRGAEVTVQVSRGPDLVTVPDVTSVETLDEAVALLEASGLKAGSVVGPAAGSPASTSPGAGESVKRGSVVDITLRAKGSVTANAR